MPSNDVVRQNLNVSARIDFDGESEPMPMPLISRPADLALGDQPTTTQITTQTIDTAPYRSVGRMRMFFNSPEGFNASGWVVAPRAFITAGHCVYRKRRGGWMSRHRSARVSTLTAQENFTRWKQSLRCKAGSTTVFRTETCRSTWPHAS
jgi:hypothetical protein